MRKINNQLGWITIDKTTIIRKFSIEEINTSAKPWLRLTSGEVLNFNKKEMEEILDKLGVITEFK